MPLINRGDRIDFDLSEGNVYGNIQGLVMTKTNPNTPDSYFVARITWLDRGDGLIERDDLLVETGRRRHSEELERLCQVLLKAGYGRDVALEVKGELSATKGHLADMRRLVFHSMGRIEGEKP